MDQFFSIFLGLPEVPTRLCITPHRPYSRPEMFKFTFRGATISAPVEKTNRSNFTTNLQANRKEPLKSRGGDIRGVEQSLKWCLVVVVGEGVVDRVDFF